MPEVPDGVTAQEVRAKLFSEIARRGILPTSLTKFLPNSGRVLEPQCVVDRAHNGRARTDHRRAVRGRAL